MLSNNEMWVQCLRAFREEGGPYLLANKIEAGVFTGLTADKVQHP